LLIPPDLPVALLAADLGSADLAGLPPATLEACTDALGFTIPPVLYLIGLFVLVLFLTLSFIYAGVLVIPVLGGVLPIPGFTGALEAGVVLFVVEVEVDVETDFGVLALAVPAATATR
jgi:hypothetical protein